MAYALALSKSSMTSQAITKLKSIATIDGKRMTVFGSIFTFLLKFIFACLIL